MNNKKQRSGVRIHRAEIEIKLSGRTDWWIKKAVRACFKKEKSAAVYDLDIIFVHDRYIRGLNREYLGKNNRTDVLCFPYNSGNTLQADMFISVDSCRRQAVSYGHTTLREILFVVVHGVLHLLGWEDRSPASRKKMWLRQEQILSATGVPG
ncbi:MAG: rRNA maturation RNase YbeY [Elusimicrobia bacterium]|nr:rRNA maturation RNase YbeY [Elusimicrobiota bacterium]